MSGRRMSNDMSSHRSGPYHSGDRQRRRRGDHRGAGGGQQDEASNVYFRLVKLGDQPDKLLSSMRDMATTLDAFLGHDVRAFFFSIAVNPSQPITVENIESVLEEQFKALLSEGTIATRLPSLKVVLDVMVDCIELLTYKHSYYSCLLWFMIHETLGYSNLMDQDDIETLRQCLVDICNRHFQPVGTLNPVKGEIVNETNEDVPEVLTETSSAALPVKHETKVFAAGTRKPDYKDRSLFYLLMTGLLIKRLTDRLCDILASPSGLHLSFGAFNIMRVLCDFANVNLLAPKDLLGLCEKLCAATPDGEQFTFARAFLMKLGGVGLMWTSPTLYRDHQEQIDRMIETIVKHRDCNFTEYASMCDALVSLRKRKWVSKSLPRLYDSAKLKDLSQRRVFDLPQALPRSDDIATALKDWDSFVTCEKRGRPNTVTMSDGMDDTTASAPLWKAPAAMLTWHEPATDKFPVYPEVLTNEYQASAIEVELMQPCDVFILDQYVTNVLVNFCKDLDRCAESLLLIPCKHDQFLLAMTNRVLQCLFAEHVCLSGGWRADINIMDGVFAAQLIRRLCILEKSLTPHVYQGVKELIRGYAGKSEVVTRKLVDFLSVWMLYTEDTAADTCNELLALGGCSDLIKSLKNNKPDEETGMLMLSPLDPLYLQDPQMRLMVLALTRVSLLFGNNETFQKRIPPYLRRALPKFDLFGYNPTEVLAFCQVDADDSSRCRIPSDLPAMKQLTLTSRAPLEATLLRDLMRLQLLGGKREQVVLVSEANAMLKGFIGTEFIQSLRDFGRTEQDLILFKSSTLNKQEAGVKWESSTMVKTENATEDETPVPVPAERVEAESVYPDYEALESSSSVLLQQSLPRFDKAEWIWDIRNVSKLLSLVLHTTGGRTLTHFQRTLELYSPVVKFWKEFLRRNRSEDVSEIEVFETFLLEHTFEMYEKMNNITRVEFILGHLVTRDCVSFPTLLTFFLNHNLFQTLVGDYMFPRLLDWMLSTDLSDEEINQCLTSLITHFDATPSPTNTLRAQRVKTLLQYF